MPGLDMAPAAGRHSSMACPAQPSPGGPLVLALYSLRELGVVQRGLQDPGREHCGERAR